MTREPVATIIPDMHVTANGNGFSRWFLCDLQVHTIADQNQRYGDYGARDPSRTFAEELIETHANAGVDVIAVTDHNRVDWYPMLRAVGEEQGVWVFPGTEVSVNGCHLLAIWDCTDEGFRLAQDFLKTLWKPGTSHFLTNGDPRPVSKGQIEEIAAKARDHSALVLAPHSTQKKNGLFASGVASHSKEIAQGDLLAGFDVYGHGGADVLSNPAAEFGEISPRWFISGDVRSFDDCGERACYLKLGEVPTLEGLRQAFLAPSTRIRFPSELEERWGHVRGISFMESSEPDWPRIERVTIAGGFHNGMELNLAPGLNAIIGGKGTGKSALIEVLRYLLEAPPPTAQGLERNREVNFGANCAGTVEFVDIKGTRYEAARSGDDTDGELRFDGESTDVDVSLRIRPFFFGQQELQHYAQDPELRRSFVASLTAEALAKPSAEERSARGGLDEVNRRLEDLEEEVADLEDLQREVADLSERLKRADDSGAEDLLKETGQLTADERAFQRILKWPSEVGTALKRLEESAAAPPLPTGPLVPKGLLDAVQQVEAAAQSGLQTVETAIASADDRLEALHGSWSVAVASRRVELEGELEAAGVADLKDLIEMQKRLAEIRPMISDLPKVQKTIKEANGERRKLLGKLRTARQEKSRAMQDTAERLTRELGTRVRITVDPLSDRSLLIESLLAEVAGQNVRRDQIERVAEHAPPTIAKAMRTGTKAVAKLGCSTGTAAKLAAFSPEAVRRTEEVSTPDRVSIEVNLAAEADAEDWSDVSDVSPGQRATAMLALALASGDQPLLIDQPEDDLDNRYIFEEVVRVLARVCERRQVIVATHNANIPVLGDAELVLALDAKAKRSRILACGGFEDRDVASYAREILEGGDEAFMARHKRYLSRLESKRE